MNNPQELVFMTDHWAAYVMPDQLYLGRMVVPLLRPCRSVSELSAGEIQDWLYMVKVLEHTCQFALGATMFNWCCLMNNAYQDPDPKPQVHWHFRPRYANPPLFDGNRFPDPNFGQHYLRGPADKRESTPEFRQKLAGFLRQNASFAVKMLRKYKL